MQPRKVRCVSNFIFRLPRKIALVFQPKRSSKNSDRFFYPQQRTCQIPSLNFIFELFFGQREVGTFVEIGAYDGIVCSNTWGLSQRGWNGWLVEPNPSLAQRCREAYARYPNVKVIEVALSSGDVAEVQLFLAGILTTANTALLREYQEVKWARGFSSGRTITVPATTLDRLLQANEVPQDFDLLVVDVEGYESQVFQAFDLRRWRPKMMIIELLDIRPDLKSTASQDHRLHLQIIRSNYVVVYKDAINTVFVRQDVWDDAYETLRD